MRLALEARRVLAGRGRGHFPARKLSSRQRAPRRDSGPVPPASEDFGGANRELRGKRHLLQTHKLTEIH